MRRLAKVALHGSSSVLLAARALPLARKILPDGRRSGFYRHPARIAAT